MSLLRSQALLMASGSITLSARQGAAAAAAAADIAAGGAPFFAAIGDSTGTLWNNGGVGFGTSPPTHAQQLQIASATKPITAAYFAQTMTLNATHKPFFEMKSGYHNMSGQCAGTGTETVSQCLLITPTTGGYAGIPYNTRSPQDFGADWSFWYDGGHEEYFAGNLASPALGSKTRAQLTSLYRAVFGFPNTAFTQVNVSGGLNATPDDIAAYLTAVCHGDLAIGALLDDPTYTPVNASEYFTDGSVSHSPAPNDEPWLMHWAHWVEPGGLYYWGSGTFGFSFWFNKTRTLWGIVARQVVSAGGEMGVTSIRTAQAIRTAWLAGRYSAAPPPFDNPDNTNNVTGMVQV